MKWAKYMRFAMKSLTCAVTTKLLNHRQTLKSLCCHHKTFESLLLSSQNCWIIVPSSPDPLIIVLSSQNPWIIIAVIAKALNHCAIIGALESLLLSSRNCWIIVPSSPDPWIIVLSSPDPWIVVLRGEAGRGEVLRVNGREKRWWWRYVLLHTCDHPRTP